MSGPLVAFTQPSGGVGETGQGGAGDVVGPASAIDRQIAVYDGTTGKLLGTGVATLSPAGALEGVTQITIDNLRLDGNSISSLNVNGDISLAPNGSGSIVVPNGSATMPSLRFVDEGTTKTGFFATSVHWILFASGGVPRIGLDGNNGHLGLASGGQIRWGSGSDPSASPDVGFFRSGVNELTVSTFAGSAAALLARRSVEANTSGIASPNLISALESGRLFTNEGAAAENYHALPPAAAGLGPYGFYCQNANGIRVVAGSGDTIRIEATVSLAAGFVRSGVVGSMMWLECINATEWVASSRTGTWTVDTT